jgi:superfamily II DNA or RNA helicase
MQCGPIRHVVSTASIAERHSLELRVRRRDTNFESSALPTEASIQEIYGAPACDTDRLELIVADAREAAREGRAALVLTERRDHLERLADRLREHVSNLVVLHGGIQSKARRLALKQLADLPDHEGRLVLATGRYIGEGFDDPRLDTLLLAMPIAWKGTVVQYAGRLHRAHPAKREVRIYDYVDSHVPVLRRMYAKRLRAYRKMGYIADTLGLDPAQEGRLRCQNPKARLAKSDRLQRLSALRLSRLSASDADRVTRRHPRPPPVKAKGRQMLGLYIAGAGFEPATFGL